MTPGPLVARCHTTIPAGPESYMWKCSHVRCPGAGIESEDAAVSRMSENGRFIQYQCVCRTVECYAMKYRRMLRGGDRKWGRRGSGGVVRLEGKRVGREVGSEGKSRRQVLRSSRRTSREGKCTRSEDKSKGQVL